METPLIRTKVSAPITRKLVARRSPLDSLINGQPRRLTLVRAPAGWGKSSLLSAWAGDEGEARPFAWLSLDGGDNDPSRFFTYAIEALRTLAPTIGDHSLPILKAPGVSLLDDVLPVLLNELDGLPEPSVLVMEDYHLIKNAEVHEAISFVLEHTPPALELVISSRVEPPLPIARLRGRGEILEIAAAHLGFSVSEAQTLLNGDQRLRLDPADVSLLVHRTEGWPAGIYLAALSLRHRDDPHEFIENFAGDDRNVVDYLTTEVLTDQPTEVLEFLLVTSVLERLTPGLCDQVTGRPRSAQVLRQIEASNAFLIALDNRREWYRYHQLFRDLLRSELVVTDPALAVEAHRRAAAWLAARGDTSEAVNHLISAGDTAEAVELVASSWLPLASSGGHQTVHSWLTALPREVHRGDARLCVASAVTAISTGRLDEVGEWLDRAADAPAAGPFHDGFASGAAAAGCLRAAHKWLTGDLVACRASALDASKAGGEPSPWDAVTYLRLGASTYWLGDSEPGIELLETGLERSRLADFPPPRVSSLGMLGLIHLARGELDQAQARADAALELSGQAGLLEYWINVDAHTARAGLLTHAGRLDEARSELDRALELARRGSGPVETIHALVAHGIAARAAGEDDAARSSIAEARLLLTSCASPGPVVTTLVDDASARLPRTDRSRQAPPLFEDFSERELDVLRLLGGELSQREIADLLFISFNTVKSHSKSIYRKLGVGSRTEAVARARELAVI